MDGRRVMAGAVGLGFALACAGCAGGPLTQRERTTLGGAALGAGAGAIIGEAAGHRPGQGALIGGGIGALGGALLGDQLEGQRRADEQRADEIESQEREIRRQRGEIDELRRRAGDGGSTDDRDGGRYNPEDSGY